MQTKSRTGNVTLLTLINNVKDDDANMAMTEVTLLIQSVRDKVTLHIRVVVEIILLIQRSNGKSVTEKPQQNW